MDTTEERLFTRDEYVRMAATGILRPEERVQLLQGRILVKTPQGHWHRTVLHGIGDELRKGLRDSHYVFLQVPFVVEPDSEPEPDVVVVPGKLRDYADKSLERADLIVEVSQTSLARDRRKRVIYAAAGVAEYWIVDLATKSIEVLTDPRPPQQPGDDASYATSTRVDATGTISPLFRPTLALKVADLLLL
jgi:Uma2 family endonuclease